MTKSSIFKWKRLSPTIRQFSNNCYHLQSGQNILKRFGMMGEPAHIAAFLRLWKKTDIK
jgi:hypothetical protein